MILPFGKVIVKQIVKKPGVWPRRGNMKNENIIMKDGKRYVRVTEIISPYLDFSQIPPQILQNACDRGTKAHIYAELYAKGLLFETIDPILYPYIQAYVDWYDENIETLYMTEQRLFCDRLLVTGKCDLIAKVKGLDGLTIVDLKTTYKPSKSWSIQTAAYMHLAEISGFSVINRIVVHVAKDSTYKIHQYLDHEHDKLIFENMVKTYRHFFSK